MKGRILALGSGAAFLWACGCGGALAADGIFDQSQPDVAQAWLDLLFRGISLPPGLAGDAPNLDLVASALHRALGFYSVSILVLAGLLLFYNIAVMIMETAHYGIPLGRRSTQIWGPIRLVLAMSFLVPVSGGLNAGQYLVTWMAEKGSSLASHAWSMAANEMKSSFSGVAPPRGPDVASFVAGGLDMEFCRSLYRRAYVATAVNSAAVRYVGNISQLEKIPRTRFAEETWQYTNRLHEGLPLCGAYHFAAGAASGGDVTAAVSVDRVNGQIAEFSRSEAEKLTYETQSLAEANAPVFLGEAPGPGVHDQVAGLIASHQAEVDERIHTLMTDDPGLIGRTLSASADAGWITAGGFLLELARLQTIYSTMAAHLLPSTETPQLATGDALQAHLVDTIKADPNLAAMTPADLQSVTNFYAQVERTSRLARGWLYDRQLPDLPLPLADPFDMRDELSVANDPASVSTLFGHVLNDAAVANGVWNVQGPPPQTAMAIDANKPVLALPASVQNPVTALAEFGQRQAALGNYLFAIAGPDVAPAGTLSHSLLLGGTGLGFMASGYTLMFLVPLLPFIRFFIGILTWLLNVFEAVIAVPVVALAHLNFSGEGLSGGAARQAYVLWLNILIRPVLALFGLIIGLLLFTFGVAFLDMVFHHLMYLAVPAGGEGFAAINVALTFFYTILIVAAANASFKGITLLPEMAVKWLGGLVVAAPSEAVASAVANASSNAQALPGAAPTLHLPAQGGVSGLLRQADTKIMAAAKSYGLKMALFPQYSKNEDRIAGEAAKPAAIGVTKTDAQASANAALNVSLNAGQGTGGAALHAQQKYEKKPKEKRDAVDLARLTEVPPDAKVGKDGPAGDKTG